MNSAWADRVSCLFAALRAALFCALFWVFAIFASGCSASATTSGAAFSSPESITNATFCAEAAETSGGASIDVSQVADGFVGASATSQSGLKFQISSGQYGANYDLPNDGTPIVCPLTFGDGAYTFRIMQNTSGNNYVELFSTQADVTLASEFAPFLRPSVFCDFNESSACVAKAKELVSSADTQAAAVASICEWVVENISYDNDKAASLKAASGYVPNPDETLASASGICFDYASLGAAMLRSQGIPTKIVTGYVSPGDIYHAWIMVYIDGEWKSAQFSVEPNEWSRIDLTFAAGSSTENVGDGKSYTDRFVY